MSSYFSVPGTPISAVLIYNGTNYPVCSITMNNKYYTENLYYICANTGYNSHDVDNCVSGTAIIYYI
nr:MAG TPA: hypothetical protein [Caudoviricetes sp.]